MVVGSKRRTKQQRQNYGIKILPYQEDDPPTGPAANRPRATASRGPRFIQDKSGLEFHSPRLTILRTSAPPTPSSLARGRHGGAARLLRF
jgi:hypothetical protein